MKKYFLSALIASFFFFNINGIGAQDDSSGSFEEMLDQEMKEDSAVSGESDDPFSSVENKWVFFGFFQNRNFFSANRYEDTKTLKNEGRVNLNARYGNEFQYVKIRGDLYLYPSDENNREEKAYGELREVYFTVGENLQFSLGKRIYQWGSADVFNVVNYLDQADQRKLFATDKEDRYSGVYSASLKFLFSDFGLEAAAVPYFSEPLMPEDQWQIQMPAYSNPLGEIPMVMKESPNKESNWRNASYASRFGGNIGSFDFHLTYFNGISKNFIFYPELEKSTVNLLPKFEINTTPVYSRVQSAGLDFAFTWDKLSVRSETSYTYNMPAVKNINKEKMSILNPMMPDGIYPVTEIDQNQYISYSVGLDYNLWGNNGRVFTEWMEGYYLINRQDYTEPFLNRLLIFRLEDKWINESMYAELGSIIRPIIENPGYGILYKLGWDFKNGLTMETEGYFFFAGDDEFFGVLEQKDMVALSAKMTF